jgi:hypothetical protein
MDLELFKRDCIDKNPDIVVQKYIIDGPSFFFDNIQIDEEFEFKRDLAESLDVHIRDIVIVGSGKLGFSIKPDADVPKLYRYKKFDFDFEIDEKKGKSDLDVAIVSGDLFDKQLIKIHQYTNGYSNENFKGSMKNSFSGYILKGWLRPDLFPKDYIISMEIKSVQDKYRMKYGRDINIGLYKSWYFFENYHQENIRKIKLKHIAE